jgi:hypothetical protein
MIRRLHTTTTQRNLIISPSGILDIHTTMIMTVMIMVDAGDRGVHKISRWMIGGNGIKFSSPLARVMRLAFCWTGK